VSERQLRVASPRTHLRSKMMMGVFEMPDRLNAAGLRSTRTRRALAALLFNGHNRHVTAEQLHGEAVAAAIKISLATVYNTLNAFTEVGLLGVIAVDPGSSFFDTNTKDHYHFYFEETRELIDIPSEMAPFASLPAPPAGTAVHRIDLIIRICALQSSSTTFSS
jgi:Fur family transcriptional regulator, iron response regulator